jgi:hypothetical protein
MVRVKAVTQPRDTGSDLVECNTLLAPIWYALAHACRDVSLIQSFCCRGGKLICRASNGLQALEGVAEVYRKGHTALVDEHLRLVLARSRLVVREFLFGGVCS